MPCKQGRYGPYGAVLAREGQGRGGLRLRGVVGQRRLVDVGLIPGVAAQAAHVGVQLARDLEPHARGLAPPMLPLLVGHGLVGPVQAGMARRRRARLRPDHHPLGQPRVRAPAGRGA